MKRMACFAIAAALAVGCTHNKDESTTSSAASGKYGLLKGAASSNGSVSADEFDRGPEPAVNAKTHFAAGQLSESQGNLECAQTQYEQAIRLNPKYIPALYRMGVLNTKLKKYDDAVSYWKQYIDATGNVASGYSNLGFTYEMAADVENAEAAYKEGIAIDPKNASCRINYGLMLARQNRTDEATEQLALVLTPAEVSYNLATVYEQQGALARAKEELEKAIAANPNMKEAQNRLANLPQD